MLGDNICRDRRHIVTGDNICSATIYAATRLHFSRPVPVAMAYVVDCALKTIYHSLSGSFFVSSPRGTRLPGGAMGAVGGGGGGGRG